MGKSHFVTHFFFTSLIFFYQINLLLFRFCLNLCSMTSLVILSCISHVMCRLEIGILDNKYQKLED